MTRRALGWTWFLLIVALAGCNSLQRDAEVTRDQWEPETATASK
jgi:hypothetical protein